MVVPRADVAVPGSCLSDYWAFWTLGTPAAAAAAPLREGKDRKKEVKFRGRRVYLVFENVCVRACVRACVRVCVYSHIFTYEHY